MKLPFFLVALCLVLLRAYFSFAGHGRHNDDNNGTLTVSNGDYYEQVKWSGRIVFTEDENSIASIPPGGYLKFRENDAKMIAESNLQGEISYTLYDGHENLPMNDSGKHFISASIRKMIARGFNAGGRAERINKKGGYRALMAALPALEMENIKEPYLDLLFKNDSLSKDELAVVIKQTGSSVTDADKENLLKKITASQRKDSMVSAAWLDIVAGINADIQKVHLLSQMIDQDSLSASAFEQITSITARLNADIDKSSILTHLIKKGPGDEYRLNKILQITSHFNADIDKQNIYNKLIDANNLTEEFWINMINAAAQQNSDIDKSNSLIRIAQKMPKTEKTKAAYLTAAKKINNDADYGRAVKIID